MPMNKNAVKGMVDGDATVVRKVVKGSDDGVKPKTLEEIGVYQSYLKASNGDKAQADRLFKLGKKYGFDEVAKSIGGKNARSFMTGLEYSD
jgi:hypothetical protein